MTGSVDEEYLANLEEERNRNRYTKALESANNNDKKRKQDDRKLVYALPSPLSVLTVEREQGVC